MGTVEAVRAKLNEQLGQPAREAYWRSLSSFLRFEITKAEFDRAALAELGPHAALHNDFIVALLQSAQHGGPSERVRESSVPMDTDELAGSSLPQGDSAVPRGNLATEANPHGDANQSGGGDAAAALSSAPQAAGEAAPKLMLKIGVAGGKLAASAQGPNLVVDPKEEAQLNALHDRLLDLCRQQGLQSVQPEAVAFMQRAVRAVTNRVLVAAVVSGSDPGVLQHGAEQCVITGEELQEAIRQPAPAPWMTPPSQRPGYTLGAFSKFVP